jgi:hypothetical protein
MDGTEDEHEDIIMVHFTILFVQSFSPSFVGIFRTMLYRIL